MKKLIFWLILGLFIMFWYFFIKANPQNIYIVKGQTRIKKAFKEKSLVWITNPASSYCIEKNWKIEIKEQPEWQIGVCIFPDGSFCEERSFFRWECSPWDINATYEVEISPDSLNEKTYCTEEQKLAEICTMEYMPVCWSDWKAYWNKCTACSQWLEYYTKDECIFQEIEE